MKLKSLFMGIIIAASMALGLVGPVNADETASSNNSSTTAQTQQLPQQLPAKQSKEMQMLFTQTAAYATLDPHQGKERWFTLTLHNVNPSVLWFSERPDRISGTMNMAEFIKTWKQPSQDSFTKDHPNANLVVVVDNKGVKSHMQGVFVLTKPVYDEKQQTLTYDVFSISGAFSKSAKNSTYEHVALFVDGSNGWCGRGSPFC